METSERSVECENVIGDPLVVTELNAVEEPLSTVSNVSEATIPVEPAMHAVARTGICSNFSPGDPFIIIEKSKENLGEKHPVMSSTEQENPNAGNKPIGTQLSQPVLLILNRRFG